MDTNNRKRVLINRTPVNVETNCDGLVVNQQECLDALFGVSQETLNAREQIKEIQEEIKLDYENLRVLESEKRAEKAWGWCTLYKDGHIKETWDSLNAKKKRIEAIIISTR